MTTVTAMDNQGTNRLDFVLTRDFTQDGTFQASLQTEEASQEEMQVFLNALRATADEFDDVLRKLAD